MKIGFRLGMLVPAVVALVSVFAAGAATASALVTTPIDEARLTALPGATRPEARVPDFDRGRVADSMPLEHIFMELRRPREREAAFARFIDELSDPTSPRYHQWLDAEQIGALYGPDKADIDLVAEWLQSHGFSIKTVYPSGLVIDFSGTAGAVRAAFHTEIHALNVRGQNHIANMSDPAVPSALAPVIAGIVSLHDFHPHGAAHGGPAFSQTNCGLGSNSLIKNCNLVSPADVETIYDINPLFAAGITGKGQTIAVIEDSDLYSAADWTRFRKLFGLTKYASGSLETIHPKPANGSACGDPGTNNDDFEVALDVEYATASAPDAKIEVASCADAATWGVGIAIQNLVNSKAPPPIINVSYVWCEPDAGASFNALANSAYQQAVAEGISVYVAAGDWGAAPCDLDNTSTPATSGIGVNGLASSVYDVAVGGTDFGDTYHGTSSTYWATSDSATYGSAKSYVPEIPWNNSCGNPLIAKFETGSAATAGTSGFCNSTSAAANFLNITAGSGGPSDCATGVPASTDVVGGTCKGYTKPSWQRVFGNPADGKRDLPDIALFSAGVIWGHAYVVCLSDPNNDYGTPCSEFPNHWIWGYGTSFASPIMAGVQALINQSTGTKQGNPNPVLYKLAQTEFGTAGSPTCSASLGRTVGKSCVFHDVVEGSTDIPCASGSPDCYLPSGTNGILSTSTTVSRPTYNAAKGWDFATGLGSVDVANLVKAWPR